MCRPLADDTGPGEALEFLVSSEPSFELVGLATDADQAIELARQHRPDVALVDFKMPAGGGPRATREISACSPATRVVALSAYEDRASIFEMLRAGAVSYIVKGTSSAEIQSAIVRSARGERVLSSAVTAEVVHELTAQLQDEAAAEDEWRERVARIKRVIETESVSIVFQPIVELHGRMHVGYEALARFRPGPEDGAGNWFAEAAEVGLRNDLELTLLRLALQQIDRLPSDSFISVNADPNTLLTPEAASLLMRAPLDRVVLEVTEHAAVADYETLRNALSGIRKAGGRLAVDDAGAGFASLTHVLQLSPDILKIDGSVIRGIQKDRAARALTSALLTFATEMNQMVIAEGIEDEAMVAGLEELGVRYGQGYHLGRPALLAGAEYAATA